MVPSFFTPGGDPPPPVLFHGTCCEFEKFSDAALGKQSGAPSSSLGHFFSTNPTIAASFSLRPEVVDAAFDTLKGSSVLLNPRWVSTRSSNPYAEGSRVVLAVADLRNTASIEANEFAALVDQDEPLDWVAVRADLLAAGYDSIQIRKDPVLVEAAQLAYEYAADTWIALEGASIRLADDAEFHLAAGVASASMDTSQTPSVMPNRF